MHVSATATANHPGSANPTSLAASPHGESNIAPSCLRRISNTVTCEAAMVMSGRRRKGAMSIYALSRQCIGAVIQFSHEARTASKSSYVLVFLSTHHAYHRRLPLNKRV